VWEVNSHVDNVLASVDNVFVRWFLLYKSLLEPKFYPLDNISVYYLDLCQ
jgi:hypothetical protein